MHPIILASASPRRQELLQRAGFAFTVQPADVDETVPATFTPDETVRFLSAKKARHIAPNAPVNHLIIGADTVVALDDAILGKPADHAEAFTMLRRLQGRWHTVYTGVTVLAPENVSGREEYTFVETARVCMRPLTDAEIEAYIATGEPFDKAGSYGIQEKGALLIERVEGDYFTVVGLPLCRLGMVLSRFDNILFS